MRTPQCRRLLSVHAAKFPQRAVTTDSLTDSLTDSFQDGKQTLSSFWPVDGPLWAGARRRPLKGPLTGNGRIRPLTVNGVRELRHAGRQTGPNRRLLRVSDYDLATEARRMDAPGRLMRTKIVIRRLNRRTEYRLSLYRCARLLCIYMCLRVCVCVCVATYTILSTINSNKS